jgi:type IV pilus assembly protein PilB
MAEKIGDILVKANLITRQQLQQAIQEQKSGGGRLGTVLVKMGFVNEDSILSCLSSQFGVPAIDLDAFQIDNIVLETLPVATAKKYMVIPISRVGNTLTLAMADPSDIFAMEDIKFMTNYNIEPVVASESSIIEAINRHYGKKDKKAPEKKEEKEKPAEAINYKDFSMTEDDFGNDGGIEMDMEAPMVDINEFESIVKGAVDNVEIIEEKDEDLTAASEVDAPVVKLVNGILLNGVKRKVSDIHIEPYEKAFRVRYRLDGDLYEVMKLPLTLKASLISRVKIMAQLDIAEKRLPQDGRIKLKLGKKKEIDFRVSTLPTLFGEKVVLRLLDKSNLQLDLTKLGFESQSLDGFKDAISKPYGMILVTGPTGSGKTTTLYSALQSLNTTDVNIMTAEDPVEFNLMGINQVQMREEVGLTFASALRSFLRQDPDVILVGEIRDFETAEIAIKAALTGHLVLSTLHTNDAPGTINRLLNMGIEPFLVASSVLLIVAQRLLKKICQNCKEPEKLPMEVLLRAGLTEQEATGITSYKGKGCEMCNKTGYKGRIALYEVMVIKPNIRELILRGASTDELKAQAIQNGMLTLRMSGLAKLREGITSLEQVLSVTLGDS